MLRGYCSPMGLAPLSQCIPRGGYSRGECGEGCVSVVDLEALDALVVCSVHLARRVLQLERINVSLRDQLKREEVRVSELAQELSQDKELLGNFEQPYNYLVSRVKEQKALLVQSKNRVTELVAELEAMKKERSALIETKNFMAADLERLLNHREVITKGGRRGYFTMGR